MLKLYIAVHDDVVDHMVPVVVAHAVLGAHLAFEDNSIYHTWLTTSFKKVVVRVNDKEFERIKEIKGIYLGHEIHTMEGRKCCAVLMPTYSIPNVFKFSRLWKPKA